MFMQPVLYGCKMLTLGDIATFPYSQQNDKPLRIEHWDVAINHGRVVANHIVKGDSFEGSSPFTLN